MLERVRILHAIAQNTVHAGVTEKDQAGQLQWLVCEHYTDNKNHDA